MNGRKPLYHALILIVIPLLYSACSSAPSLWRTDEGDGVLTLYEGDTPVLAYRFGDQLPDGIDPAYTRSCYIHPLYGLDGTILTADFPADHFHHHGLFWTWPDITVRGEKTQTWHPANLRQYFVRWLERETTGKRALLRLEVAWRLDGEEQVAREIVTLTVHPAEAAHRRIGLTIALEALGGPLTLKGASEGNKGYGGLCLRGAEIFTGARLFTDAGPQDKDVVNTSFQWADMSAQGHGITITVDPAHPAYPIPWLIRRGYAGILNPSWPGLQPVTLEPGSPVTLSYHILIHDGSRPRH
jgi:hypothetical protein